MKGKGESPASVAEYVCIFVTLSYPKLAVKWNASTDAGGSEDICASTSACSELYPALKDITQL